MQETSVNKTMGVGQAIVLGHLLVTLPVLIFMCGVPVIGYFVALFVDPFRPFLLVVVLGALLVGFVMAWTWWSLLTPRWRQWAHQQGVPPDQLQRWAVMTGLVWPKGWIFEKTEYKWDD